MAKEIVTDSQGISIVVLFIVGSAIVLSPGSEAKQDAWLAIFMAFLMALPAAFVYARLLSKFPGFDLFDIFQKVMGKLLGKIIGLLYIWYAFHMGALVIRNFTEFIQLVSLPKTPQLFIAIFFGIICIWIVKAGIEVMGRWANIVVPFVILAIAVIISLSLTEAEFNNIKPILYNGINPVIQSAFSVFAFPYAEIVVLSMVFISVKNKFNIYKVYNMGLIIGFVILIAVTVRNILVLGVETSSTLYFPAYSAVSMIDIDNFLQRIEIVVCVIFLLAGIIKTGACLYAASNGIAKIFNYNSHRALTAPIGLLMINLSYLIINY